MASITITSEIRCLATVLLLLTVLNLGCQHSIDPSLSFGPDGQPRITSVQLKGIPDQNIQVDQTTHQITVTVPANFSAVAVPTHFQLTQDTRVTSNRSDSLYIYPFTPNDSVKVSTSTQKTNTYQFVFKSTNELNFARSSHPLIFTINPYNNYLCLPIYNLVDGDLKSVLVLTNKQSGHQITQPQYYAAACDHGDRKDGAFFANVYISGQNLYEPGDYTAEFIMSDGQRATFNQTIQIQRGSIFIYFPPEDPIAIGDNTIAPHLFASNLFASDKPSLQMRARGQTTFIIKPTKVLTGPLGLELPLGAELHTSNNIQPGYYYAQLLVDSKPVNSFVRIPVVRSYKDLVIQDLYDPFAQGSASILDPSMSFDTPIMLKHDKRYILETNEFVYDIYYVKPGDGAVTRVRLTSLSDPSKVFFVPIVYNSNISGNLQFLSTIPSGLYQFTFEILTADKTVLSSEPLERDVLIQ